MKKNKLIEIIRQEIRSVISEVERNMMGVPGTSAYASGVIHRVSDEEDDVEEGAESGYKKLDPKKLPTGYDTGEFGSPKDYANFGGSGFKKGKDWSYGPRGKEVKIGDDIPSELDKDKEETGYKKVQETDIRKKYGNQRIDNPKTGNAIKLRTALKAKKGTDVYRKARQIYNRLKDQEES